MFRHFHRRHSMNLTESHKCPPALHQEKLRMLFQSSDIIRLFQFSTYVRSQKNFFGEIIANHSPGMVDLCGLCAIFHE
jgi:hypothetical protein